MLKEIENQKYLHENRIKNLEEDNSQHVQENIKKNKELDELILYKDKFNKQFKDKDDKDYKEIYNIKIEYQKNLLEGRIKILEEDNSKLAENNELNNKELEKIRLSIAK